MRGPPSGVAGALWRFGEPPQESNPRNAGCVIAARGYTLILMQPWREFLLPNPTFPTRAYNLPGVRIGSLRLVPASKLLRAANALNPFAKR